MGERGELVEPPREPRGGRLVLSIRQNHAYSPGPDSHACLPFSFELCWSPAISRSLCCAHEKVIQEKVAF